MNGRVDHRQARLCLFIGGLLFLFSPQAARAQVAATISGRVQDASGATVPGVTVAVKSLETGAARVVTTDEGGNFKVLSLAVGEYEVKAEKTGFKAALRTGIHLVAGQEAVVNLRLEVGEVFQQVTVSGELPLVNTTTAPVSGLVGEAEVKDLPLNGRSFDNLITLNPGVINYSAMKTAGTSTSNGNTFSVEGRRPLENLFLLNGIEYTGSSQLAVTPGGVSGSLLGIDAVREINVLTDTYSAAYGKRAGAQVSIVTQSGSNALHGSIFEFLRNSALDARNFFDVGSIPPFRRNQFGGAAGGPLKKNRVFLFGNYEGFRQRLGVSSVSEVPDADGPPGRLAECLRGGNAGREPEPCDVALHADVAHAQRPRVTGKRVAQWRRSRLRESPAVGPGRFRESAYRLHALGSRFSFRYLHLGRRRESDALGGSPLCLLCHTSQPGGQPGGNACLLAASP